MFSQLGGIGKNGTNEFFETLIMIAALDASKGIVKEVTQDIENEALKEATQGALNVVIYGSIAFLIRVEEMVLDYMLGSSKIIAHGVLTFGKKAGNAFDNKFKGKKGVLGFLNTTVGSSLRNESAQIANVYSNFSIADATAKGAKGSTSRNLGSAQEQKNHIINKENHSLQVASAMQQSLKDSNIIKVLSASFSENDIAMLRKITGNPEFRADDVNDLNKVKDFMFVKNSEGKPVALSEAMVGLLNTMGYMHK